MKRYKFIGTNQDLRKNGFRIVNGFYKCALRSGKKNRWNEVYIDLDSEIKEVEFNYPFQQKGTLKKEIQDLIDKGLVEEIK